MCPSMAGEAHKGPSDKHCFSRLIGYTLRKINFCLCWDSNRGRQTMKSVATQPCQMRRVCASGCGAPIWIGKGPGDTEVTPYWVYMHVHLIPDTPFPDWMMSGPDCSIESGTSGRGTALSTPHYTQWAIGTGHWSGPAAPCRRHSCGLHITG